METIDEILEALAYFLSAENTEDFIVMLIGGVFATWIVAKAVSVLAKKPPAFHYTAALSALLMSLFVVLPSITTNGWTAAYANVIAFLLGWGLLYLGALGVEWFVNKHVKPRFSNGNTDKTSV